VSEVEDENVTPAFAVVAPVGAASETLKSAQDPAGRDMSEPYVVEMDAPAELNHWIDAFAARAFFSLFAATEYV